MENNEGKTSMEVKDAEKVLAEALASVEGLSRSLADRQSEYEALHALVAEREQKFEAEKADLVKEIEQLKISLGEVTKAKEALVAELSGIKEEALLTDRIKKLNDLGVLRSSEEARLKQGAKIKNMTEEEFAEYVNELVDIKEQNASKSVSESNASVDKKEADTPKVDEVDTQKAAEEIVKEIEPAAVSEAAQPSVDRIKKILDNLSIIKTPALVEKSDETNATAEVASTEALAEEPKKEVASAVKLDAKKLAEGFIAIARYNSKKEG